MTFLPRVVLVNPQLAENIGACARAMANFGLRDLRIVNPREDWPQEKALASATKARTLLEEATLFETLPEALSDLHFVYATTARPRDMVKEVMTPEQAGLDMQERVGRGEKIGLVFGRERWGLTNEEITATNVIITAPVDPHFASLNIAQAVLLVAYEWYKHRAQSLGQKTPELEALKGPGLPLDVHELASHTQVDYFFSNLEKTLLHKGFFKAPQKREKLMGKLRHLLTRSPLATWELGLLHGVVASLAEEEKKAPKERSEP